MVPQKWMSFVVDKAVTIEQASEFIEKMVARGLAVPVHEPVEIVNKVLNEPKLDFFFERFASIGVVYVLFFVPNGKHKGMHDLIKDLEDYGIVTQMICQKSVSESVTRPAIVSSLVEECVRKLH